LFRFRVSFVFICFCLLIFALSFSSPGIFWITALPFFFSFGFVLPFAPIFFASFALLKSFLELFSYEIVKSVVNKLTKNCGLKDDNEYMRNFLVFTALWPLNLYSVAHALTYPEEWTPNPIPFLTKVTPLLFPVSVFFFFFFLLLLLLLLLLLSSSSFFFFLRSVLTCSCLWARAWASLLSLAFRSGL
jgi:hypothetical protein